jgi:MFS family permease
MMSIYFTFALALFITLGVFASRVLITLYALKLGAQPFTVGVLTAMFSVLPTLLSWHVGRFSDRFGSRWLLMIGITLAYWGCWCPISYLGFPSSL